MKKTGKTFDIVLCVAGIIAGLYEVVSGGIELKGILSKNPELPESTSSEEESPEEV